MTQEIIALLRTDIFPSKEKNKIKIAYLSAQFSQKPQTKR